MRRLPWAAFLHRVRGEKEKKNAAKNKRKMARRRKRQSGGIVEEEEESIVSTDPNPDVEQLPIVLDVVCRKSKLIHSGAVAMRLAKYFEKHGYGRVLQKKADTHREDGSVVAHTRVSVRVFNDWITMSIDATDLMHKRRLRFGDAESLQETSKRIANETTPIRETLAAAALRYVAQDLDKDANVENVWKSLPGDTICAHACND